MRADQLRLCTSALAYVLRTLRRQGLQGTASGPSRRKDDTIAANSAGVCPGINNVTPLSCEARSA
jgi:hypothetical protein